MKRIILAILAISAICFAQSSEKCNPNPDTAPNASTVNYDPNLLEGTCYNVGYVCQLSMESSGGVRFILGKNQDCSELESTHFVANHVKNDGSSIPLSYLQPYLQEGPVDNVSGLVVAMNTAFLINASNERFKIRVAYHQISGDETENSVRILGLTRYQIVPQQQN